MNWVSSTLQLAEDLLESVDQQAAITLLQEAETDKRNVTESEGTGSRAEKSNKSGTEEDEWEEFDKEETCAVVDQTKHSKTSTESLPDTGWSPSGKSVYSIRIPCRPQCEVEQTRLRKEIAMLKQECSKREKLVRSTKQNTKALEKELEDLEGECSKQIKHLQVELSEIRSKSDSEQKQLQELLATKDAAARSLRTELEEALRTRDNHINELNQMRQQLEEARKVNESVTNKAQSTSDESEQLIASLRSEVQETLSTMNSLKREFAESKVAMYASQHQLESSNEELAAEVARLQRERIGDKLSLTTWQSRSGGESNGNNVGTESFGDVVAIKKALHDEMRQNEMHQQEIASLNAVIAKWKCETEKLKAEASRREIVFQQEKQQLQHRIGQSLTCQQDKDELAKNKSDAALDARVNTLMNRILDKQETIDNLRSKLITLEARLTDAQYRQQLAEEKLATKRHDSVRDIEAGDHPQSRFALKRSPWHVETYANSQNSLAHALLMVSPAVRRYKPIVSVLNVLDQCFLFFGRRFLRHPFTRVGIMAYFILLHLWVFVILSFHTSHLDEELQAENRLKAGAGTGAT